MRKISRPSARTARSSSAASEVVRASPSDVLRRLIRVLRRGIEVLQRGEPVLRRLRRLVRLVGRPSRYSDGCSKYSQKSGFILPTSEGESRELRIRSVVRPDRLQADLLDRLGLRLPERLRISPAQAPM